MTRRDLLWDDGAVSVVVMPRVDSFVTESAPRELWYGRGRGEMRRLDRSAERQRDLNKEPRRR